jgi:lactate dehydrogenase-like 2-hydroxyacid dehydrogenase
MTTNRPDILLVTPLPDFILQPLAAAYTCHDYSAAADGDALIREVGSKIRGLTLIGAAKIPPGMLDKLPNLEVIPVFGVGYDGVPLDVCRARGIKVSNTPDVLTDDVADIALALILMLARNLVRADHHVRAGDWERGALPLATAVGGKTCGLLGLGRIGKAIAQRVQACGMQVAYYGRSRQEVPYAYLSGLHDLAAVADFLVVAVPGGEPTRNLVDASVLRALGDGARKGGRKGSLVNIARGSIVDEAALVAALEAGTIKGAGLDVFASEPHVPAALLARDDVVLLPHVGSATRETRKAMGDLVIANFAAYFAGRPLLTPVPELAS